MDKLNDETLKTKYWLYLLFYSCEEERGNEWEWLNSIGATTNLISLPIRLCKRCFWKKYYSPNPLWFPEFSHSHPCPLFTSHD